MAFVIGPQLNIAVIQLRDRTNTQTENTCMENMLILLAEE